LIDANALELEAFPERYTGKGIVYVEDIDKAPTVDAVELPKGKPGDYLEWDNGTGFKKIYCIYAVMICEDCVRYDLEKFTPEVNHKNIVRIMSREQAVKEYRDRCTRERTEEEPTFTAVKGERKDNDL
jgi:hypothetical protein